MTNYGFMEGNTDKIPKEALLTPIKRLINGYENIGDINKLRGDFFPIKITESGTPVKYMLTETNIKDIIKIMKDSLIYRIDKDAADNLPIYFGGFILEDYTARISIRILHDYQSKILTLKRRNILMVNKIEDFLKTSLHIKQITNIIEQVKLEIEKIKAVSGASAEKVAKTMVDTIGDMYATLKKDEMQNLLEWNDLLKTYKDMPEAFDRKFGDVLKKRETIITKVYYEKHSAQLIKLVFDKLYEISPYSNKTINKLSCDINSSIIKKCQSISLPNCINATCHCKKDDNYNIQFILQFSGYFHHHGENVYSSYRSHFIQYLLNTCGSFTHIILANNFNEILDLFDDINYPHRNGSQLLHFAAQQSKFDCIKYLLDRSAVLFDLEGKLVKGAENKTIFDFSATNENKVQLYHFLIEYFKLYEDDNSINLLNSNVYIQTIEILRF